MSGHICQMDRGQISWVTSASYDICFVRLGRICTMLFPSTVDIHVTMLLTSFYPPSVSGSDSLINPPLSLEIPPIGSATYPLGKWRDAVLAGKPWNTTDDERTSTCRIHYPPSQPKCLSMGPPGTQKKRRGVNRWDRWDRLPFRRAYSMFDTYLQGLFYFLGGGRWDRSISLGNTLSWENPWNVECLSESISDQIPFVETNQTRGSVYCQKVLFFWRR